MKYVKTFELFQNIDPQMELEKTLKHICTMVKQEIGGSTEHPSEYFGEGNELEDLADKTDDARIKSILDSVAKCCLEECEGGSVNILEFVSDDDCHYIADFLGLPRLNLEQEWTEEEENTWYDWS